MNLVPAASSSNVPGPAAPATRRRALPLLAAAAASALLVGCTVGPDYKGPPDRAVPAAYANTNPSTRPATQPVAATQPADLAHWWRTFGDGKLDDLIRRTADSNLDLRAAVARIRQARAQYGVTAADLFPQVNTGADATYGRTSRNAIDGGSNIPNGSNFNPGYENYRAGFDASWELDVFGGLRRATEAARYDIQAAQEDARDALVSLLAETARNYLEYRAAQQRVILNNQNIRSQQETVELTRARFNAGLTSDLDVARAEAQVASTRAALPTLLATQEAALQRLAVLLGTTADKLRDELSAVGPIPASPPRVPVGIPSELLRRRPDVRRAERQLAASTARIGVATADLFPRFNLTGSLGLQSNQFKSLGDWDSRFWSIGPSVAWPIFDAGRIRSNIRVQNALQEQAAAQYEKAVLQSLADVETSLNAFGNEQDRRDRLAEAVAAQTRAVDLAQQLYAQGLADFLNVLEAQRALYLAQDQLVQSDQSVSTNLVSLYKALGGGWNLPEQLASTTPTPNDPEPATH